jgi:hypothetical protein
MPSPIFLRGNVIMSNKMSGNEYIQSLTGQKAMVKAEKKSKKLCIIGTAGSRHLAPYDDKDADIWGVAHCLLLNDIPRMDRVFEIHLPYIYEQEISPFSQKPIIYHANKEYACPWRKQEDIEVITPRHDKSINKQIVFPRDELKEKYRDILPAHDAFYATNSIAWMILWGIELGYDEIHLYGIHLECDSEWQFERPCNEWWLGVFAGIQWAKGKKNVIYIPEQSDVLRGYHEYGFADIEVRRKKLNGKKDFFDKAIREMVGQLNQINGELSRLQQERAIPTIKKIEMIKGQRDMFQNELDKFEAIKDPEAYEKDVFQAIDKRVMELREQARGIERRLDAFGGAKEQIDYFLKELNA